jgi:hypothetical protein
VDSRIIVERACLKQITPATRPRRVLHTFFLSTVFVTVFLPIQLAAQEPEQTAPTSLFSSTQVTVQGEVINAATGQPVPRALVRIVGDAESGALTDSDGRFEIPGVPTGPQSIQVTKPGYRDHPRTAESSASEDTVSPVHNVQVSAQMPNLVFTLEPTSSIHGLIEFSTGDPAEGITINLLRQTVEDGRAVWTPASITKSNSEGAYRFAGLAEGSYVLYTEPALESDPADNPYGAGRAGYESVFYPDARDLAGAAPIQLASGDQAQANLTLTLEPFQFVTAAVQLPQYQPSNRPGADLSATIMDAAGHQLPDHPGYSQETRTFQVQLPDGTYSLLVASQPVFKTDNSDRNSDQDAGQLVGAVDFTVSGHDVQNLRIPLSVPHPNPVQLVITRTALSPTQSGTAQSKPGEIQVVLSPAGGQSGGQNGGQNGGWIGEGIVSAYASGYSPGPMEATWLNPGSYWVHTHIGQKGLCEDSFTGGGASLAREPVILGLNGSVSPMTLTLRDDCASLTLSLPQSLMANAPGEEPFYTAYAVPDFDSTEDVVPVTLRPSSGGTATIEDLTPGNYHVYTFNATARLQYHDRSVLASLPYPGQPVTLSAGTTSNLVMEAPEP